MNLKTLCIDIDKSGELRNSNHPVAWKIADMDSTDNGSEVVFAMRLKGNVSQNDNLVIASNFVERTTQAIARVLGVA